MPPAVQRTEAIRTAAARPLNWPRFLRVARRHQVIGLVHDGLTHASGRSTNWPPGARALVVTIEALTPNSKG